MQELSSETDNIGLEYTLRMGDVGIAPRVGIHSG